MRVAQPEGRGEEEGPVRWPAPSPLDTRWREKDRDGSRLVVELAAVVAKCLEAEVAIDEKLAAQLEALLEVGARSSESAESESCEAETRAEEWREDEDCGYTLVSVSASEFERLNSGRPARRRRSSFVEEEDDGEEPAARRQRKQRAALAAAPVSLKATVDRVALRDCRSESELLGSLEMRVVFDQLRTGFEDTKDLVAAAGAVVGGRYRVDGLVGRAAFSTAYAASDLVRGGRVCLKVIKNSKDFFDQSLDEIKLLKYLNESGDVHANRVVKLLDFFYYREHLVIASELLGENLFEYARRLAARGVATPFPEPFARRILADCLVALNYVHSFALIHCDVKPENLVLVARGPPPPVGPVCKLVDFGSSCFTTDKLSSYVQSRSYRAPEVVLGNPYGRSVDLWSLGCVAAEIHAGYVLFQNDSVPTMLARIAAVLGPFPPALLADAPNASLYFTSNFAYLYERLDSDFFLIIPKRSSLADRLHLPPDSAFLALVTALLALDPARRPSALDALRHPWFTADSERSSPRANVNPPRR